MAIRIIAQDGDPVLKKRSRPVEFFDKRLHMLLEDMAETMAQANGLGLAAPQVAVLRRAVVIDVGEGLIELVNPEIIYESAETISDSEGCLSAPGEYGLVARPKKVVVRYFDRDGRSCEVTGEALLARALCHEIDHLNGISFKDIASEMLDPEED